MRNKKELESLNCTLQRELKKLETLTQKQKKEDEDIKKLKQEVLNLKSNTNSSRTALYFLVSAMRLNFFLRQKQLDSLQKTKSYLVTFFLDDAGENLVLRKSTRS